MAEEQKTTEQMDERQVYKFNEDELKQIKEVRQAIEQKLVEFGDAKVARINLESQLERLDEHERKLTEEFFKVKESEQELTKHLNSKYGNGTLNIDTGEFTVES